MEVRAHLPHRRGRDVFRVIPDTQPGRAAADFRPVARARLVAAGVGGGSVVLEAVAAVAFRAVLEAGEGVVVGGGGAEAEAGREGHERGGGVGGGGEGARGGFVGAAEVGPAGEEGAGGGGVGCCLGGGAGAGGGGGFGRGRGRGRGS